MSAQAKAYGAASLFAVIIGLSFFAVKVCLEYASVVDILAHRYLLAGITALAVRLIYQKPLGLQRRDYAPLLFLTLFYPILFFLLQVLGLQHLQSVEAGIIQATSPVFTVVFALLILRERTTKLQGLFILISIVGVAFIFVLGSTNAIYFDPLGTVFLFGSTLAMSMSTVLTRRLARRYSVYVLATMMAISGCVLFCVLAFGVNLQQGTLGEFFVPLTSPRYVFAILFLGIASSYVSSFLSTYALSKLQASKMSVFMNLSTILALFAGVVFLHESLYWFHIVGAIAVIAGVMGVNLVKKNASASQAEKDACAHHLDEGAATEEEEP